MIWYLENYQRSRREREALESLASSVHWLTPIGWRIDDAVRMIWDADLLTPGGTRPISLRYPNHFPHSPPSVMPRGSADRWSEHQYGPGGELCLEYGADNWHPDITGADMIASAYRLLQGEQLAPDQSAAVASRHNMTLGQDLRSDFSRLLVTRALVEVLARIPEATLVSANTVGMYHGDSYVHVIASITMPDGQTWREELPEPLKVGYQPPIALFRWPRSAPLPPASSLTAFRVAAAAHNLVIPAVNYAVLARGSRIHVYFMSASNDSVVEVSSIPPRPVTPRLDKSHVALRDRKAALVGCGSLGSKIAVSLARSGLGRFLLVDDDILMPENLVRHDLDWREIGTHKANSVASRIKLVNPAATCEVRKHRLGGQEASGSIETLLKSLADCDLMIDATAEPTVFNYLCAAVAIASKPLLWAEIFGGGFGGLIARHRPPFEPDPASMRSAIENWCAERGQPIERAAHDYGGGPGAPAIADDADVAVIAAHAARIAIDTLISRDPSMFPHSVYLVGLAKGWIFEQPFETHPIDVGPPAALEPEEALDPQEEAEELARIAQLLKEHEDAATSGAQNSQTP